MNEEERKYYQRDIIRICQNRGCYYSLYYMLYNSPNNQKHTHVKCKM